MPEEKPKKRQGSEKKLKQVEELVKLINYSRSIMIVSIKNLPAKQFQLIKKKLKENAVIKVVKKNIAGRAIDMIKKGAIKNLKKNFKEDRALIFSKLGPFELSGILARNKSMARAKIGQVVSEDVVIEAGPTELVPGPVISELGSLGIQFTIEDGKINIQKEKIILKAGKEVNESHVSIMSKLDMKPIAVGLEPVIAYDGKEDKIYEDIKIEPEETLKDLREKAGKASSLAIKVVYYCKETISYLISKAKAEENILASKIKEPEKEQEEKEEPEEEEKKEIKEKGK